ncbi:MAG: DUF1549 domain-containing protein [Planctomycetes bacterium]|nr:DUF1549 domain-containing protein [Planctomycetota bacterium]
MVRVRHFAVLCAAACWSLLVLTPSSPAGAQETARKGETPPSPADPFLAQCREKLRTGEWKLALDAARQAHAADPKQADAVVLQGQALFNQGDLDGALAAFDKVTNDFPGREYAVARADALASRALVWLHKREYLKAVDSCYFATLEKYDHVDAHANRALAYVARRQYDRAIQSGQRAIDINPKHPAGYSVRGLARAAQNQLEPALADQQKAIELDATFAPAYQRRGAVYLAKNELDNALKDLDEAVRLSPNVPEILCDRAYVLAQKKDSAKALADVDLALQLQPGFPKALLRKGQILLAQGTFDKAIENFNEAIRLKEDHPSAYCYRGYALAGRGEYSEAIKDFTKAISLDPDMAEAYSGRSQVYKKIGKQREAKADQDRLKPPAKPVARKTPAKKKEEPAAQGFIVTSKDVDPARRTQMLKSAKEIDRLVDASLARNNLSPNPRTTDEQFLRRVYLDITGSIPTFQQTRFFLSTTEPKKRTQLIDDLLNSDRYASHSFNYWADVLRYTDSLNPNVSGDSYRQWLKQSLAENKPWNKLVSELLTAEGLIWQNPATGYIQRDANMPLDNMNNTVRIFLGTRIGCAQCHNHPFDRWKQKEFYQMAAFTFGTVPQTGGTDTRYWKKNPNDRLQEEYASIEQEEEDRRQNSYRFNRLIGVNMMIVNDQPARKITLPADYSYNDGKPGEVIEPKTLFGAPADVRSGEPPRRAFARWLTGKDNPRFALTVANRLWKQCFGVGQIEPVDDMMDSTVAENPELMQFLEAEMKRLDFDLKEFLRILYNTEAYQRQASSEEVALGAPYHFPGPILRRMTAEQVWDSFLTMAVVKPDEYREFKAEVRTDLIGVNLDQVPAAKMLESDKKVAEITNQLGARQAKYMYKGTLLARASELPTPVPPNHFLRTFGQSDRELISASSTTGSVPQVLFMFNGPITHMLLEKNSTIYNNVMQTKTVADGVKVVFRTVLNRDPDDDETELAKQEIKQNGPAGYGNVIWALVNTREFLFIQ